MWEYASRESGIIQYILSMKKDFKTNGVENGYVSTAAAKKIELGRAMSFNFGALANHKGDLPITFHPWDWDIQFDTFRWEKERKVITAEISYPFWDTTGEPLHYRIQLPFSYDIMEVLHSYAKELQKFYKSKMVKNEEVECCHDIYDLYFEGGYIEIDSDENLFLNIFIGS